MTKWTPSLSLAPNSTANGTTPSRRTIAQIEQLIPDEPLASEPASAGSARITHGGNPAGGSVRHEHRERHGGEDAAGNPAKNELAQTRMAVAAHHQKIGSTVGRVGQDNVFNADITLRGAFRGGRYSMADKVGDQLDAGDLFLLALFGHDDDVHCLGAFEKRHRVGNRAGRGRLT